MSTRENIHLIARASYRNNCNRGTAKSYLHINFKSNKPGPVLKLVASQIADPGVVSWIPQIYY